VRILEREHHGTGWRIEIKANDVGELGGEGGIARPLEGAQAMHLPRGVKLSCVGRVFLRDCRSILRDVEHAVVRTRNASRGITGRLRIAFVESASWHGVLPDVIGEFRDAYPDVKLVLPIWQNIEGVAAPYPCPTGIELIKIMSWIYVEGKCLSVGSGTSVDALRAEEKSVGSQSTLTSTKMGAANVTPMNILSKKISRRNVLAAGAGVSTAAILHWPANAAEFTYKCRCSTPATTPAVASTIRAAGRIKEATNGRLDITVYPDEALGSDPAGISQLIDGSVEMWLAVFDYIASRNPALGITGTGFAFPDYDHVWAAMDGDLGKMLRGMAEEIGIYCMDKCVDDGSRQIISRNKPIVTPADPLALGERARVARPHPPDGRTG
jgi:hypothetical protein